MGKGKVSENLGEKWGTGGRDDNDKISSFLGLYPLAKPLKHFFPLDKL